MPLPKIPLYDLSYKLENKTIHVYHNKDMDGLSCAFVGSYYDIADYQIGYDYSESLFINDSEIENFENCTIIFNDIVPKMNFIKKLEVKNKIIIVDHHLHMIEEYLKVKDELENTYVYYSPNICASKLLFELLNDNYENLDIDLSSTEKFKDVLPQKTFEIYVTNITKLWIDNILNTVDSYDLYKFERSILDKVKNNKDIDIQEFTPVLFNTYFYNEHNKYETNKECRDSFFNIINGLFYYIENTNSIIGTVVYNFLHKSSEGKILIKEHHNKIKETLYFHTYKFDETNYNVALFIGCHPSFYTSLKMKMMNYNNESEIDFALYVNTSNDKDIFTLSLRSINENFNVKDVAQTYFNGGGHIKASGGCTTLHNLSNLLNMSK